MAGELVRIRTELWYDGAWNAISADVRNAMPVRLTEGISNEGGAASPGSITLQVRNGQSKVNSAIVGRYSPRNAMSDLFGKIGQNTPIRVSAALDDGSGYEVLGVGEVASWPKTWGKAGKADSWVTIEAAGILQRIGQGDPLQSAVRRAILATAPIAYWPGEDPAGSTVIASAIEGVSAMTLGTTPPTLGAEGLADGSAAAGEFAGLGSATGTLSPAVGPWSVAYVGRYLKLDSDIIELLRVEAEQIVVQFVLGLSGMSVAVTGPNNSISMSAGSVADNTAAELVTHHIVVTAQQSGSDIAMTVRVDGVETDADTLTGVTCKTPHLVRPQATQIVPTAVLADGTSLLQGHWTVYDSVFTGDLTEAIAAHVGETAGRRTERLCGEEGIAFASTGDLDASAAMGPQPVAKLYDVLAQCSAAEAAGAILPVLTEQRTALGLRFRTRASCYDLDPALTLDYSAGHLWAIEPAADLQQIANDVTAERVGGSKARSVQETGPLNVQDPTDDPQGVHRYPKTVTVNIETDDPLPHIARWARHVRTCDDERFTALAINVRGISTRTGGAALIADALAVALGDLVVVDNPPAWVLYGSIRQLVLAREIEVSRSSWTVSFAGTPARPYDVGVLASAPDDIALPVRRMVWRSCVVAEALDTTETGVDITATPLTTTNPDHFPFDIFIGGELMTATNCTGASNPQTLTVTRSVNGVVKTHAVDAEVTIAQPLILAHT